MSRDYGRMLIATAVAHGSIDADTRAEMYGKHRTSYELWRTRGEAAKETARAKRYGSDDERRRELRRRMARECAG